MVLGAGEGLNPLPVPGAGLIDVAGHRGRPHEGHGAHIGMLQQAIDRHPIAVHHVEHPFRQPRLGEQLGQEHGDRRVPLGGLEHERVAAGDGNRIHPHGNQCREIERRDTGHHPDRLADGEGVHRSRHVLRVVALDEVGDPGGKLDHLQAPVDLTHGVGGGLPLLGGEDPPDVGGMPLHQIPVGEEDLLPTGHRGVLPPRQCPTRRLHRRVDVSLGGERHLRLHLAGGRVEDLPGPLRRGLDDPVVDPVVDEPHRHTSIWLVARGRYSPSPGLPRYSSPSTMTRPRDSTVSTRPPTSMPS